MSFLNNMMNEFTHKGQGQGQGGPPQGQYGQQGYPQQGGHQGGYQGGMDSGRPNPPAPWIAEWDQRDNRWIYINQQTGQRSFEFPHGGQDNRGYGGQQHHQGGYGQQGGYGGQQQYQGGYGQQGYPQGGGSYQQQPQQQQKQSHSGRNMALGALAGVAGGALLMHEGEKVEEKWDEDKYRAEYDADRVEGWAGRKVEDGVQDVEDFPENAARWTGNKVQEVEDIPDDIAQDVGDGVGDVERFGDNIADSYDQGRDDRRYEDDNNW